MISTYHQSMTLSQYQQASVLKWLLTAPVTVLLVGISNVPKLLKAVEGFSCHTTRPGK